MAILVTVLIVVVGGAAGLGYWVAHEENRPGDRPVPIIMRRGRKVVRKTMVGDSCSCGGTLEESGVVSARFGELLRCTRCRRRWTVDGRRVMARRRPRRKSPGEAPAPLDEMPGPVEP
ncbi:MAG TPA: hypothetical protein VK586_21990 [Streptosporangiaceae bacterium]|nr:hypothetical protein [Streptosporangiaceae bacterium]